MPTALQLSFAGLTSSQAALADESAIACQSSKLFQTAQHPLALAAAFLQAVIDAAAPPEAVAAVLRCGSFDIVLFGTISHVFIHATRHTPGDVLHLTLGLIGR